MKKSDNGGITMRKSMAVLIVILLTIVALCAAFNNVAAGPDPKSQDKKKGGTGLNDGCS